MNAPRDEDPQRTIYQRRTRSQRALTPVRRALYRLLVPLALLLIRAWWASCRIVSVRGAEPFVAVLPQGAVVNVLWHQHLLFATRYLLSERPHGLKVGFLVSPSVDGEVPAMLAERAGAHVIRGSATSTGARALRDYLEAARAGVSPLITPDGSVGPRYEFKPGAILLSQLAQRPIVPIAWHANRVWLLKTWDRFVLPWPFARIAVAVGEPRQVPKGLDAAGLQRWQEDMARELRRLYLEARDALR
jgi:lysophospholipid acyltransferase (LPLAT)-like uncharacterized protein